MIRITIEVNDKEVSSTTVQSSGSGGLRPAELLTSAAAVSAIEAGSAPSDIAPREPTEISAGISHENASSSAVESISTLATPSPELLTRAAALGAFDAGSAPSEMAAFTSAETSVGSSRDRGSPTEYAEGSKGSSQV